MSSVKISCGTRVDALARLRRKLPSDRAFAPHPEGRPAELTAREREVLRLLAGGAANKQIAHRLNISIHTVERHVANAYIKIGARNRAEATAYVLRDAGAPPDRSLHSFRDTGWR